MSREATARQLADLLEAELIGDGSLMIRGVADLASAGPGDISFLAHGKYEKAARVSQAGVVLVSTHAPRDFSFTQIRVAHPSQAFCRIVAYFAPPTPSFPPEIHPAAVVSTSAILGKNVHVGPCAIIEPGAHIGDHSIIGAGSYIGHDCRVGHEVFLHPRVVLRERTVIGHRVIIHSGAVIGADGFGYELDHGRHRKVPQMGYVQIDDDVEIGANTTIDRGRFDKTWIQEGAKIDNLVQIAHNVVIGRHCILVSQCGVSGSTRVGDYVTIAGQAGIVGHVTIGNKATITAQSGVAKSVPAGAVLAGRHAIPLKESLKLEALVRRLPEWIERLRRLEEKS